MIGYDLVSFQEIHTHRLDERFIKKTLIQQEISLLKKHGASSKIFWAFWAIKESCYKSLPEDIQEAFNPLKFNIQSFDLAENLGKAKVQYLNSHIYVHIQIHTDYVEAVSRWNDEDLSKIRSRSFKTDNTLFNEISAEVRKVADNDVKTTTGKTGNLIFNSNGKPLTIAGKNVSENISISHHGNLAGFAYLPE